MTEDQRIAAWNALVMDPDPLQYPPDDPRRAAALVALYMALANNGGILHYLELTPDHAAAETLAALQSLGATEAAAQFTLVLSNIGTPLPVQTSEERSDILEAVWTDDLDELSVLSEQSDTDLTAALDRHLDDHGAGYLGQAE